jgi:hypothetical protein
MRWFVFYLPEAAGVKSKKIKPIFLNAAAPSCFTKLMSCNRDLMMRSFFVQIDNGIILLI